MVKSQRNITKSSSRGVKQGWWSRSLHLGIKHFQSLASGAILFFAVLYLYPDNSPNVHLLQSLERFGRRDINTSENAIAIGWNTNLDLIVDGIKLMNKLKTNELGAIGVDHSQIDNQDQLDELFAFYFKKSAAVERYVSDASYFDRILEMVEKLEHKRYRTGGNAALMANKFAELGHPVYLGGPVGQQLRKHLHENVSVITDDSADPAKDQVHLIMEYMKGSKWNEDIAIRSNRIILTHDNQNSNMFGMEAFYQKIDFTQKNIKILAVSGIHLLEFLDTETRTKRLKAFVKELEKVPMSVRVHLEFASIGDPLFAKEVADTLFPHVDSIGMNEQELTALYEVLGGTFGGDISKENMSSSLPLPIAVASAIKLLIASVHSKSELAGHQRGIRRVHFHSYAYHIIALAPQQHKAAQWAHGREAVAYGSIAATTSACNHSNIGDYTEQQVELVSPLEFTVSSVKGNIRMVVNEVHPVAEWNDRFGEKNEPLDFYYAPVVNCKTPVQTVGLGDAISTSGLSYSI